MHLHRQVNVNNFWPDTVKKFFIIIVIIYYYFLTLDINIRQKPLCIQRDLYRWICDLHAIEWTANRAASGSSRDSNKKFQLMLTRRAKAYSSSGSVV